MTTHLPDALLILAEAAQLHREATAARQWPMWFVTTDDPAHPGRHAGRVHTTDYQGGVWLPGALVADTLEALVGMMPVGLTRRDRMPIDLPGMVETWD